MAIEQFFEDNNIDPKNKIHFTPEKLANIKAKYNTCRNFNRVSFEFEDKLFLVSHTKYLIEYLEEKFRRESETKYSTFIVETDSKKL